MAAGQTRRRAETRGRAVPPSRKGTRHSVDQRAGQADSRGRARNTAVRSHDRLLRRSRKKHSRRLHSSDRREYLRDDHSKAARRVMASAAATLKHVTLELGGSDPMIVCDDADLDNAVKAAATGRFFNCGQACLAIKRLYLFESIAEDFINQLTARVKKLRVGNGLADGTRSEEHTSELQSLRHLVCRLLLEKKKNSTWRATSTDANCSAVSYSRPSRLMTHAAFRSARGRGSLVRRRDGKT